MRSALRASRVELGDRLLLAGDDPVVRLVVLRPVDRDALPVEVAHVAVAGGDLEVLAEELPEGGRPWPAIRR